MKNIIVYPSSVKLDSIGIPYAVEYKNIILLTQHEQSYNIVYLKNLLCCLMECIETEQVSFRPHEIFMKLNQYYE